MKKKIYDLYKKALQKNDLKLMKRLYNENKDDQRIAFDYAKMLIKANNYTEAEDILIDLFVYYNNTLAALEFAKLKFSLGEVDLAKKYFKSLINSDKASEALYELGKIELDDSNYKEAREHLEKAYNLNKKDYYVLSQLGRLEYEVYNYYKAREYFKTSLELAPNWFIKYELAKTEFKLGNHNEAKKLFLEVLEEEPGSINSKIFLGKIEGIDGNYEKAKESLIGALSDKQADKEHVTLELGRLEVRNKNYDEARKYLETILNSKFRTLVLLELGLLEFNDGDLLKSKEYLEMIDMEDGYLNLSQKVDIKNILSRIENTLKNYDKAKEHCKWILNYGEYNNTRYHLARIEILNNNLAEARNILEQRAKNDVYCTIELGKLEFLEGNLDQAKIIFESLLKSKIKYWALFELARVEIQKGNIDIARKYYLECLNANENVSYVLLELARLEYFVGNVDKSEQYLNEIIINKYNNYEYAIQNMIILYINQERYLEAFDYIKYLEDNNFSADPKTKLFIMKKLNIFFKDNDFQMRYNNCQIADYDEYIAIEHICERHAQEFASDIDIYSLFNEVQGMLNEKNYVGFLQVNDMYHIPYPNISSDSDTLRVITLPNSKQILTMFPLTYSNSDIYNYSELGTELVLKK